MKILQTVLRDAFRFTALAFGALSVVHAALPAKDGGASGSAHAVQVATLLPGDALPAAVISQLNSQQGEGDYVPPDETPSPPTFLAIDAAQTAITACTDTASGVRVGVAVTDAAGVVHVSLSADGAVPGRAFLAARKALAAVEFKLPTSEVKQRLAADRALQTRVKPNMIIAAGAVPLIVNGQLLGAIGVAGGTAEQNERCAVAGAARIIDKLK